MATPIRYEKARNQWMNLLNNQISGWTGRYYPLR